MANVETEEEMLSRAFGDLASDAIAHAAARDAARAELCLPPLWYEAGASDATEAVWGRIADEGWDCPHDMIGKPCTGWCHGLGICATIPLPAKDGSKQMVYCLGMADGLKIADYAQVAHADGLGMTVTGATPWGTPNELAIVFYPFSQSRPDRLF